MSSMISLGSSEIFCRPLNVACQVEYSVGISWPSQLTPSLEPEVRARDILDKDIWIQRPNLFQIHFDVEQSDKTSLPEDDQLLGTICRVLETGELWKQLEYECSSQRSCSSRARGFRQLTLILNDRPPQIHQTVKSTVRASRRIFNGAVPRHVQAPSGIPACNFDSLSIKLRIDSDVRRTGRSSRSLPKQPLSRFDSGVDCGEEQSSPCSGDSDMLDLFDDDAHADLFEETLPSELSSLRTIVECHEMPAYNTDALSAELLVKVIDAAIRTVMSPRTTNIDVDLKVKKSDDFIRLDQLAPAVWKPAFLRAIAMHAAFTPTISNVMRKHHFSSLGLSASPDSLDQRDERHRENEAKLWCLMYRKLSKDVPGMRLAPVRLNNARNIMDGANSDDLFGDTGNQRQNAVTDSTGGVRSQEENESDEEDLFASEDAIGLLSDGLDLLEDDLLC